MARRSARGVRMRSVVAYPSSGSLRGVTGASSPGSVMVTRGGAPLPPPPPPPPCMPTPELAVGASAKPNSGTGDRLPCPPPAPAPPPAPTLPPPRAPGAEPDLASLRCAPEPPPATNTSPPSPWPALPSPCAAPERPLMLSRRDDGRRTGAPRLPSDAHALLSLRRPPPRLDDGLPPDIGVSCTWPRPPKAPARPAPPRAWLSGDCGADLRSSSSCSCWRSR